MKKLLKIFVIIAMLVCNFNYIYANDIKDNPYKNEKTDKNIYNIQVKKSNEDNMELSFSFNKNVKKIDVYTWSKDNKENMYITPIPTTKNGIIKHEIDLKKFNIMNNNFDSSIHIVLHNGKEEEYPLTELIARKDITKEKDRLKATVTDNEDIKNTEVEVRNNITLNSQESPQINNMQVTKTSASSFTITADVDAPLGIDKVLVPVWSAKDGQDDILWGEATVKGDKISFTANIKDHNYETGIYNINIFAYDKSGNSKGVIVPDYTVQPIPAPQISNIKVTTTSASSFTITADVDTALGIDKVLVPVWSAKDGQDDIVWGNAVVQGNKINYTVNIKDHNYETGIYNINIFAYDKSGNYKGVIVPDYTVQPIPAPQISNIKVTTTSASSFTITANVESELGIDKVLVPVWSAKGGQDDILWGKAAVEGNKISYTVDIKDHNYETGIYNINIFAYDKGGNYKGVIAPDYTVQSTQIPQISNMQVTKTSASSFTITADVDALLGIDKVLVPVWSAKDGQDDILWGEATVKGNKISYTVNIKDHNYETGTYNINIFAYDKVGNSKGIVVPDYTVQSIPAPNISDIQVVKTNVGSFTITANVDSVIGIDKVLVPVWTEKNGQDDILWGKAVVQGNKISYTVDIKDHKNELGIYDINIFAYDITGNYTGAIVPSQTMSLDPPEITNVKISDVDSWGYTVSADVHSDYKIDRVVVPSWTEKNGQDDIVWGKATITGNTISYRVNIADHKYEAGIYLANIFAYDASGQYTGVIVPNIKITNSEIGSGWKILNGKKYLFDRNGQVVLGANKFVIDISEHNGDIDWSKVRASGVDYVILRVGYGWHENLEQQRDKTFNKNAKELERLGIPYGVYLYSYEKSSEGAKKEAQYTLDLIKGRKISLPIFYDLEYDKVVGDLSSATYIAMAKAYCEAIEKAGYTAGIYANLNYWNTKLNDKSLDKYVRWVAQYNTNDGLAGHCDYKGPYKMWQYTSVGKVAGIKGNVDLNAWY